MFRPCIPFSPSAPGSRGDYFANASGKGLLQAIRSHFAGKFGDPQWKPDLLCCEEDV